MKGIQGPMGFAVGVDGFEYLIYSTSQGYLWYPDISDEALPDDINDAAWLDDAKKYKAHLEQIMLRLDEVISYVEGGS